MTTATTPAATAVCGVRGCGSSAAYLDSSTERTAGWVRVHVKGTPPKPDRWFHTMACAAAADSAGIERAARTALAGRIRSADEQLTELYPDDAFMQARIRGLQTALRIVSPDQPDENQARCWLCGCTDDDACAGGCYWVPNGLMVDACSNCVPPGQTPAPCLTAGCRTAADNLDENDPFLFGWIRLQVAGAEQGPVWVCSPQCAGEVMAQAAAELEAAAEAEAAAPRGSEAGR